MDFGSKEEEKAMKYHILSLLIKQAHSDKYFSSTERKYLAYTAKSLNVSDQEVEMIRFDPDKYLIKPPKAEHHRITILYYLLFMTKADGVVDKQEENLLHVVGFQMGFRDEMIERLLNLLKTYLNDELPPESMLEEIKPYLN